MRIEIYGYRDWALDLFADLMRRGALQRDELVFRTSGVPTADFVFLVGWSEVVPHEFYADRSVFVLHPSPLPKYRGGSPIQHQIINGETESAVTIFKLQDGPVDSGPIVCQWVFSLRGNLADVLGRIAKTGADAVFEVIKAIKQESIRLQTQNEREATTFKRRTPEQSEITLPDIRESTAEQLYDKIRALQNPYPNAYIVCGDGRRLYLTGAHL